jgi:hypothetical protein
MAQGAAMAVVRRRYLQRSSTSPLAACIPVRSDRPACYSAIESLGARRGFRARSPTRRHAVFFVGWTPLAQIPGGGLRLRVPVELVDSRGVARVPCPTGG